MMNEKDKTRTSRFLSLVLRHQPAAAGVTLDEGGWAEVELLLRGCSEHGHPLSRSELEEVVATNPKRRFALSDDGRRIRASQGHSVEVELGYEPAEPPEVLFHGTVQHLLPAIRAQGLRRMERHHVHLSPDEATARVVGARRGVAGDPADRRTEDAGRGPHLLPNAERGLARGSRPEHLHLGPRTGSRLHSRLTAPNDCCLAAALAAGALAAVLVSHRFLDRREGALNLQIAPMITGESRGVAVLGHF